MQKKLYRLFGTFAIIGTIFIQHANAHLIKGAATKNHKKSILDTATFAAGCFWCTEAKFQQLKGVKEVISGYPGGHVADPSYKLVCTGTTGHAEACNIVMTQPKLPTTNCWKLFLLPTTQRS